MKIFVIIPLIALGIIIPVYAVSYSYQPMEYTRNVGSEFIWDLSQTPSSPFQCFSMPLSVFYNQNEIDGVYGSISYAMMIHSTNNTAMTQVLPRIALGQYNLQNINGICSFPNGTHVTSSNFNNLQFYILEEMNIKILGNEAGNIPFSTPNLYFNATKWGYSYVTVISDYGSYANNGVFDLEVQPNIIYTRNCVC